MSSKTVHLHLMKGPGYGRYSNVKLAETRDAVTRDGDVVMPLEIELPHDFFERAAIRVHVEPMTGGEALMAGETIITVVGNLTADPELRYTQNGLPVANFTIASTPRTMKDGEWKDGDPLFLRASVWREFAEHVAGSLTKGMSSRRAAFASAPTRTSRATSARRSSWRSTRSARACATRRRR